MRTLYLPLSDVIVSVNETTGEVEGFMAFVDDFLAALFVGPGASTEGNRHQTA